jgi:hypothetical protein
VNRIALPLSAALLLALAAADAYEAWTARPAPAAALLTGVPAPARLRLSGPLPASAAIPPSFGGR